MHGNRTWVICLTHTLYYWVRYWKNSWKDISHKKVFSRVAIFFSSVVVAITDTLKLSTATMREMSFWRLSKISLCRREFAHQTNNVGSIPGSRTFFCIADNLFTYTPKIVNCMHTFPFKIDYIWTQRFTFNKLRGFLIYHCVLKDYAALKLKKKKCEQFSAEKLRNWC